MNYICNECGKRYALKSLMFRCTCGGMLNLEEQESSFSQEDIVCEEWSLFRYIKVLPFNSDFTFWKDISMGEGLTPIVQLDPNESDVLLKLDYLMPTLSFKDRGAVVLIAKAKELGVKKVIQDSSGNAGTSVAAYANRAGIECDIYVPASTSQKKVKQIAAHGATVHLVEGTGEDTAAAALRAVEQGEGFYASHVYNPLFYQGTKTYVYEIYEQLNGNMPDALVIPVGNGTLLLGSYYGLCELYEQGLIDKLPRIIAVQVEGCSPIHKAFHDGSRVVSPVTNKGTVAEGIAIADPKRGKQILEALRNTCGEVITAPEGRIVETRMQLAKKGFYVEPTTAATLAAYAQYRKEKGASYNERVVIPLCGAGLKAD